MRAMSLAHDKDDAEIENFRRLHRLPSSIVTGTYVLPSIYGPSAPLVGASITLTSLSGQRFTAKTDADGGFTFFRVSAATVPNSIRHSTWLRRGLGSKFRAPTSLVQEARWFRRVFMVSRRHSMRPQLLAAEYRPIQTRSQSHWSRNTQHPVFVANSISEFLVWSG